MGTFDLHQPVRVKNVRGGKEKWIQGTIAINKTKQNKTLSQEIPVMPQAKTSSQFGQVPNVGTELAEVPTTVVQINSDPDARKVPVSNPHFVGTPVKVTRSGRVSKPPERLNL